jgi:hypothetical protein
MIARAGKPPSLRAINEENVLEMGADVKKGGQFRTIITLWRALLSPLWQRGFRGISLDC